LYALKIRSRESASYGFARIFSSIANKRFKRHHREAFTGFKWKPVHSRISGPGLRRSRNRDGFARTRLGGMRRQGHKRPHDLLGERIRRSDEVLLNLADPVHRGVYTGLTPGCPFDIQNISRIGNSCFQGRIRTEPVIEGLPYYSRRW
jgi:hypothetical protein